MWKFSRQQHKAAIVSMFFVFINIVENVNMMKEIDMQGKRLTLNFRVEKDNKEKSTLHKTNIITDFFKISEIAIETIQTKI